MHKPYNTVPLSKFDPWYDAGKNYAKTMIKVWIESDRFRKTSYKHRDEFYDIATDTVEKFTDEVRRLTDNNLSLQVVNINAYFDHCISDNSLTFNKLFHVLIVLLYEIDLINNVGDNAARALISYYQHTMIY